MANFHQAGHRWATPSDLLNPVRVLIQRVHKGQPNRNRIRITLYRFTVVVALAALREVIRPSSLFQRLCLRPLCSSYVRIEPAATYLGPLAEGPWLAAAVAQVAETQTTYWPKDSVSDKTVSKKLHE